MIKSLVFIVSASAAQLFGPAQVAAETIHSVKIYQHPAIQPPISAAASDKILAKMGATLQASRPSCDVRFVRDGDPSFFDSASGSYSINSEDEFDAYKNFAPGALKIVGEIGWCGAFGISFGGCSSIAGPIWLVTSGHRDDINPILWLHEYSHTTGNVHRNDASALMRPEVVPGNLNVDQNECSNIVAGTVQEEGLPLAAVLTPAVDEQTAQLTIEQFIDRTWPEGVPFAAATKFTDDDIPYLDKVLRDRARSTQWANAVGVLGAIGTIRAKYVLMNFLLSEPNATLTPLEYKAKASVPVALGWLIQRSKENGREFDLDAVVTLIKMTNDKWWKQEAKIDWKTSIFPDQRALIGSLIVKAIMGLSLSGDPVATYRLLQLAKSISAPPDIMRQFKEDARAVDESLGSAARKRFQQVSQETVTALKSVKGFISEALKEHKAVLEGGLKSLYEGKQ